jgi:hypothetical protein
MLDDRARIRVAGHGTEILILQGMPPELLGAVQLAQLEALVILSDHDEERIVGYIGEQDLMHQRLKALPWKQSIDQTRRKRNSDGWRRGAGDREGRRHGERDQQAEFHETPPVPIVPRRRRGESAGMADELDSAASALLAPSGSRSAPQALRPPR